MVEGGAPMRVGIVLRARGEGAPPFSAVEIDVWGRTSAVLKAGRGYHLDIPGYASPCVITPAIDLEVESCFWDLIDIETGEIVYSCI